MWSQSTSTCLLSCEKSVNAKLHEPLPVNLITCNAIYKNCTNYFCIWVAFLLFLKTNMPKGYLFSSIFNVRHNEQKHVNLDKFCLKNTRWYDSCQKRKKVFFLNKVQCSQCHLMINKLFAQSNTLQIKCKRAIILLTRTYISQPFFIAISI